MQPVNEYKVRIKEIIDEAPDVKTFRVERPPCEFFPGQFFMVRFENNEILKRAYSVASSPLNKEYIDITMNLVGQFTSRLWKLDVGDNLVFAGPYGKFYFNDTMKQNLVLIGGGLGITPLMSIIRYCHDKRLGNKINLVYSVKSSKDIIYWNEVEQISKDNFDFESVVTVTRPQEDEGWHKRKGRVDRELLKQNIVDIWNSLFFICGSLEFSKSIIGMLEELGVKREQIKTDIWG